MLERFLRIAAITCSLLVAVGWLWFAADQTNAASKHTQDEIAGQQAASEPAPEPDQERDREKVNTPAHEFVDDTNDVLLVPRYSRVRSN